MLRATTTVGDALRDDYTYHEHLEMFNEPTYAFIDGDDTHYVREQDVQDIFEMQEVLPREFP